jgi:AraC-like DNA-binding protein
VHVKLDALPPPLTRYVSALHYHEGNADGQRERILPAGNIHLLVNLHADEIRVDHGSARGAVLQGPQARSHIVDFSVLRAFVTVDFTPGGAARLFASPLAETRDLLVDLVDLWGPGEAALREQLLEAPGPARKLAVLAAALQRHLDPTPPDPAMVMAAAALRRGAAVAGVAAQLGLRPGTFVRRFRAATGLAPKRFARVQRLQRVVAAASAARGRPDWAQIAAEHGYADQAHLIHDFRDLTGLTPTEYCPISADAPNHLPVPGGR